MPSRLIIAWRRYQRRTELLATALGATCIWESRRSGSKYLRPYDYAAHLMRDVALLRRARPRSVILQVPPHLPALAPHLLGVPYAIDAHNAMFQGWWRKVPTARSILHRAVAVVTHSIEADVIAKRLFPSLRTIVVRDPLRVVPSSPSHGRVVIVASASADEPMDLIADTIAAMPQHDFVTTAPIDRLPSDLRERYHRLPNITRSPFLSSTDYDRLIAGAAAVLVLTSRSATQPSGACEALGAAVPLVVSSTDTTRRLYGDWAQLVSHSVESLSAGICRATLNPDIHQITRARAHWIAQAEQELAAFDSLLQSAER